MVKWLGVSALVIASSCILLVPTAAQTPDWSRMMHERGWVAAFLGTSEPGAVPAPADRIIVKSGTTERVVYEAAADDIALGEPIVSRDGKHLAFLKTERQGEKFREYLYVMEFSRRDIRRLAELPPPPVVARGNAIRGTQLSWAHDGTRVAIFGRVRVAPEENGSYMRPRELMIIDVKDGNVKTLGRMGNMQGRALTAQAWAPDNRRLVYTDTEGTIVMLDTSTLSETALGSGGDATWSPDGRWIATRVLADRNTDEAAGYVLIDPSPPHGQRRVAFDHSPRWNPLNVLRQTATFVGPALWTPDSRFLVLTRLGRGEREESYMMDLSTRTIEPLPQGHWAMGGPP
jgi:hypothetical protein